MAHNHPGSNHNEKKRRLEAEISTFDEDVSIPRFLVVESGNHLPLAINPFAICIAMKCICGEVKNVSRLRGFAALVWWRVHGDIKLSLF